MSTKTKYKVLATAAPEDKLTYIGLLWKDGKEPNALKKYYLRKRMLIKPLEEKNALHRECEKLFEAGENPRDIAKYFDEQVAKIEAKYDNIKDKLKEVHHFREEEKLIKHADVNEKNTKDKKAKVKTEKVEPKIEVKKTSKLTKETGGNVTKSTVNKKSTGKDSSSKRKTVAKKSVSKPKKAKK